MNHAQLIALGRALRVAGEHGHRLDDESVTPRPDEIRQDLERALAMLDDAISAPKPTTRCHEHPNGPVDADAADRCLLCETRRRAGLRASRPRSTRDPDLEDDTPGPSRTLSQHGVHSERPEPTKRWIPEMWNGRAWQLCGSPRQSEQDAERYLTQLWHSPDAASAYRLVYAFTDHQVLRVWGKPTLVSRGPADL
ncbi:hypothetical protein ACIPJS_38235 [Streptomyces sp. NPDC086783]|uniref:hypothetical protein n=1 Tax=Streptomyces sp. NPDC086783 TaxID=3365758 RepID=UPI0038016683